MSRAYSLLKATLIAVTIGLALTGCPNNSRVVLLVGPDQLNFGVEVDELVFSVAKSNSDITMPPFVVMSGSPGIELLDCTSPNDGCVSSGPADPIQVRVRVDRSLMEVGTNVGSIRVEAQGIVTQFVDTVAIAAPASADFEVDNRVPVAKEDITFTDNSGVIPGWEIVDWSWDFGDGRTSTDQNPNQLSYPVDGSYTVSLTITATDGSNTQTRTARREDFIIVGDRVVPTASFTISDTLPFADDIIQFTDTSTQGTSPIVSWEWRFGDGTISREQNPSHAYMTGGQFDVYLKVVTAHGFDEVTEIGLITVEVDPPTAAFRVDNANPEVGNPVRFTDVSLPGSAAITSWSWTFGDAGISTERNPVNVYLEEGVYTVSLTVTTAHASDSITLANFINVVTAPPSAAFSVNNRRALPGETVIFTDESDPGTAPITAWAWSFGDGTVSAERSPSHQYSTTGNYEIALQVTTEDGQDFVLERAHIVVTPGTALDAYVRQEDPTYTYVGVGTITNTPGVTGHVIDMMSQTWRSDADVDRPGWDHWLTIIEPAAVTQSTALLFVAAGGTSDNAPTTVDPDLAAIAIATGSVVAVVEQTPNQPLHFTGDPFPRSGDDLIAHSFDKFIASFNVGPIDSTWPALLPMVKGAVRAMDTVQTFLDDDRTSNRVVVKDFVVTGIGIRGWTAWLTAAVDGRVAGVAPIAHDWVNMLPQSMHHFDVYGFYSETLYDYDESQVFQRLGTAAGKALRDIVDPYAYNPRYATLPKLIVSSTGDQSFVPDSSRLFLDELSGETQIAYLPNTDQNLDTSFILSAVGPWYHSVLEGIARPEYTWSLNTSGNQLRLVVTPESTVNGARVWRASSQNRDFRFDEVLNQFPVPEWSAIELAPNGAGQYTWFVNELTTGPWEGFLIQLDFDSGFVVDGQEIPYVLTTEVTVSPRDLFPMQMFSPPVAGFAVDTRTPAPGEAVMFRDTTPLSSGPVIRWLWNFGDGSPNSNEQNPSHTYTISGSYTVSLTVTTVHGSSTKTKINLISVL
jgi:PKD repeat protein